jgi:hypothetical protein
VEDLCIPVDPDHTAAERRLFGRERNGVKDRSIRNFDVIAELDVQVQTHVIGF